MPKITINLRVNPQKDTIVQIPKVLTPQSTLLAKPDQHRASTFYTLSWTLADRANDDIQRGSFEVKWGLVTELMPGDWVVVKWVTSSNPVFTAEEIVYMYNLMNEEEHDYEVGYEAMLMRTLHNIYLEYSVGYPDSRILATLVEYNVGNRLYRIQEDLETLD
ncbi:hypothetical protein WAI453_005649 [Rhynchosporium graminicola]|uniref:Uncharacterized protein n=1 Tax=Rhynchosporium graminicola TaxID=2792576 RepID=A0A1E1LF89_9HELO|nr:uncharacterized protein RCO7_04053 [Rhynchosporium commune]